MFINSHPSLCVLILLGQGYLLQGAMWNIKESHSKISEILLSNMTILPYTSIRKKQYTNNTSGRQSKL